MELCGIGKVQKTNTSRCLEYKGGVTVADYFRDLNGKVTKRETKKKNYDYYRNPDGSITKKERDSEDDTWFKKGAFEDGYQFGDVTKSVGATLGDTALGVVQGAANMGEGIVDLGMYGVAGLSDLVGADSFADDVRNVAKKSHVNDAFGWVRDNAFENSLLGDKSIGVAQGIGQAATVILTAGAGSAAGLGSAGASALSTGTVFASSAGSGMSEAYESGASDEDALKYGLMKGGVDAVTEMIFGGLGKTVNALGVSKGISSLDDIFAKKLSEKMGSKAMKLLTQYGVKSAGEGLEEVLAGLGSAAAKKLTYMSDTDLKQLVKDENLMDQFITGTLTSAIMQGGDAIHSASTGRDFVTGMTKNEELVVEAEAKKRIAEREAEGKLSNKEKNAIYDQVKSDLAKGYIGIDTIESVLGGESYKAYKDVSDREEALVKEFEVLGKKQNATLAEQARYAKLEQQIEELKGSSEKSKLKEQLSQRVAELAKGDRLAESYNEKTRRSQAYTADLSKYNAKQQAVVRAAVESGILNNTNRTHEFVDMIAKIAADKGVSFDFTNNQKLKDSGFALEGKTVNGFLKDGNISLNIESAKALNTVVGHEITHVLEGTELYGELQQAVKMYAESKGEYGKRLEALQKLYEGVEGANIENELTADLIGDYLFMDSDFVNRLSTEKPGLFKRIFEEIKYLLKTATAGSKQARELEKVKRTFEKAYREIEVSADSEVRYSLKKDEDGNLFVDVEEDIFAEKSGESVARIIQRVISERFDNLIKVNGQQIQINKTTNDEFRRSNSANALMENPSQAYDDKLRTIVNADEILSAARNWIGEKNKHIRKDDIIEFARGNVSYRVGENGYVADVIVGIRKNGAAVLYDLVNIYDKKIAEAPVTMASNKSSQRRQDVSTEDTVSQENENVKYSASDKNLEVDQILPHTNGASEIKRSTSDNSIPQIEENASGKQQYSVSDSTGRQLSEGQREYFKDSKVRDENGALKPVYHGTKAEFTEFDISKNRVITFGNGFYFGENQEAVNTHYAGDGGRVMEVYLDIKNPFVIEQSQLKDIDSVPSVIMETLGVEGVTKYNIMQVLKEHGYDGIHYRNKGNDVYVAYSPEQIKAVDNQNPTENQDINLSLSETSVDIGPIGKNVYGKDIALEEIAPVQQNIPKTEENAPVGQEYSPDELPTWEGVKSKSLTRSDLHQNIMENIEAAFSEKGYNLEDVLSNAKNLATFRTVDNTPQRVMEKALGYKEGQILSDLTVNKVAQNETEGIRWLNSFTDRKNGFLKQISKKYGIKSGSKESAAAQMYAEGFYVNDKNEIVAYGDAELAADFPDAKVRENIKGLAADPRIRQIYDETLKMINESRTRNAYPEIPRLENYFLHFRAMDDTFSRLGLPFNPRDIRAKDLPTDLNGVTADLKPGKPYFASEQHRKGKRTSFDLLGGLERYLTSAKNQIFHIDDIQTLRALRNYVVNRYGQASGLENLDILTEEEAQERISQVYGSHLSTFAKFLNEEANIIAGKTALIDRGLEGIIGRRGITALNEINRQVGANMVGFNISSAGTNFLAAVQALAKTKKAAFVKALAQTTADKASRVFGGEGDGFGEKSPVMIRRKGAERFYRTPYQMVGDWGYALMGAVDNITTEVIARAKYNEFTAGGMDADTAHYETDKWVSRLMGDRSLGQMPQLYNSRMLGLVTKFQLEVRNQLDSQFYDTIQEANVSTEEIENKLLRNAKKAAKIGSTFFQLAVMQHLFGKAYESVAGYNPAFDIVEAIIKMFGWDDEEDSEDTALDNIEEGFLSLLEDMPYSSLIMDGGRIPISSALPIGQLVSGEDDYGNEKSRLETLGEALPYYVLPGGYGQIKKSYQGLKMFDDDLPIAGSYTDSGNLRFAVEDTLANRVQAGIFGQWANENARDYFDNERDTLKEKQIQELVDTGLPMADYWKYRDGLKEQSGTQEKIEYIAGLDLPIDMKNIMVNNAVQRETPIDLTEYDNLSGYEEFDFFTKNKELYNFLQENGVSYWDYKVLGEDVQKKYKALLKDTDKQRFLKENGVSVSTYCGFNEAEKEAYDWAYKNPEKYQLSQVITKDVVEYKRFTSAINALTSDKDANGKTISGSKKKKVTRYINNLNIDYGQKLILFRSLYESDDTYNYEIVEYLNGRDDISRTEMESILKSLGFTVYPDGTVKW